MLKQLEMKCSLRASLLVGDLVNANREDKGTMQLQLGLNDSHVGHLRLD